MVVKISTQNVFFCLTNNSSSNVSSLTCDRVTFKFFMNIHIGDACK